MRNIPGNTRMVLGALGTVLLAGIVACNKKSDPAVASAAGGVAAQRHVLTMKTSVLKFSEMRASVNSDCSNAVAVSSTTVPTTNGLSGAIPEGTYHCVMFHISDLITVAPPAINGSCTPVVPVTMDIYNSADDVSLTPEGVKIPSTPADDQPWVYFSDSSLAKAGNNCFEPNTSGCACSGPCLLTPLVLNSDQTHQLSVNLDGRFDGTGATTPACTLLLPPIPPGGASIMSVK